MLAVKYLILGFFINMVTGFDDTVTRIPILASITKTRMGKIAFSIGTIIATLLSILVAVLFSTILDNIPYYRYIAAGLIVLLAFALFFDVFVHNPRTKAEKKLLKYKKISAMRFTKLIFIGFIASILTLLDDIIAFTPLFLSSQKAGIFTAIGILAAAVVQIIFVLYFSEKISKIKHKEDIAGVGLLILAVLIIFNIV